MVKYWSNPELHVPLPPVHSSLPLLGTFGGDLYCHHLKSSLLGLSMLWTHTKMTSYVYILKTVKAK
jgi:hypothetical protein